MRLKSNKVIKGVMARELIETLRPYFMGKSMVYPDAMQYRLNKSYSREGKFFTEADVHKLFEMNDQEPSQMAYENGMISVYDTAQLHVLFCANGHCPTCFPDNPLAVHNAENVVIEEQPPPAKGQPDIYDLGDERIGVQ